MKSDQDFEKQCKYLAKELKKAQTGFKLQTLQLKNIMRQRYRNLRDRLGEQRLEKERLQNVIGKERKNWDVKYEEVLMQIEFLEKDSGMKRLSIQEIDARIDSEEKE